MIESSDRRFDQQQAALDRMAASIDGHLAVARRQTENVDRLAALVEQLVARN